MDYFYSPGTGCFYLEIVHGKHMIPKDAIKISDTEHANLMKGKTKDTEIVPDEQGYPVLRQLGDKSPNL